MWGRKQRPQPQPTDLGEAKAIREYAESVRATVRIQQPEVDTRATRLQSRRMRNHFGEDIQVTFRPRGNHA